MMIFRFLSPSIALSFLLLFACGCASDPIPAWQKNLAGYVNNHGHGEISALRGLEDSPGRPGFTVISASSGGLQPLSASRTDVHGLLLGRGNFEGRSWFFFLVGVDNYEGDMTYFPLDKASISDIRLIALSWNNGVPTWRISRKNPGALAQYTNSLKDVLANQAPGEASSLVVFPNRADRFSLAVDSVSATATHTASGTQWSLQFTPSPPATKPSP